ncbi:MAG TPA: hypothetical protein VHZ26_09795 [Caulobacteraceae bacterium]|jgi:hypothetical protein|nr:hypothetical protein [Caulobacteraceae bacterium]
MDAVGAHPVIATLCVLTITAIGLVMTAVGLARRDPFGDGADRQDDAEGR